MDELTLGERDVGRLGSLLDAVRSRPVALVAVLVAVGSLATAAPAIYSASTFPSVSFDDWVLIASGAFGTRMQLGLVVAAVLMLIDGLSSGSGQRVMFVALAAFGAVSVVANLGSLIISLSIDFSLLDVSAHVGEGRAILVLVYLAPAVLGGLTCWVGVIGNRLVSANPRSTR